MTGEPENQRIVRLTPLAGVLSTIAERVGPVTPRESGLSSALARVLAEDVSATASLPARALAIRDGYAVRADVTADAGPYAPMRLGAPAALIDSGEALPPGTDAVIPLDAVIERDGRLLAIAPVTADEGVLPAGADLRAGDFIACTGWRLNDFNLAMLAMAGRRRVPVREPKICLVSSANDVVLDAICDLMARALAARGCLVERCDNLAMVGSSADAIIAVGGTGSGRNDSNVRTLARLGRVEMHGIAIAPGETTAFGMIESRPVLLLPGRIDAAIAGWLTIGLAIIDRLSGSSDAADPSVRATLARKVTSAIGLAEVVPVRLAAGRAESMATGYWPLSALAGSDGWILVPADSEGFPAGSEVMVRPWP